MYALRAIGGALYIIGLGFMAVNVVKTIMGGSFLAEEDAEAPALAPKYTKHKGEHWHRWIERRPTQLMIGSIIVILIGGVVEIVPTMMIDSNIPKIESVKPYTALELEGRDLYIREGCNACHTQMVRPFRSETERYGEYSKAGEFVYDFPFLWGSKRTGPDLHRVGGKYPHSWHYKHMWEPTYTSDGSIMPRYPWLFNYDGKVNELDTRYTSKKMAVMQRLGVPYSDEDVANAEALVEEQAMAIAAELNEDPDIQVSHKEEIIAMIAYLQRLGTDIKVKPEQVAQN